jgi:hypothetical protein
MLNKLIDNTYLVFLSVILISGCKPIEIIPTPTFDLDFQPIGDQSCLSCGGYALETCQERNPNDYPKWFGFNREGVCTVICKSDNFSSSAPISIGPQLSACAFQLNSELVFSGEVCPSGEPTQGDRDFWGHGPQFTGQVTASPDSGGNVAVAEIRATWSETEPDGSAISLPATSVARSRITYSYNPFFPAEGVSITDVFPSNGLPINVIMTSREQAVVKQSDADPLVEQLIVIGDTDGDDISDDQNCNDDARIRSITLKPVRLTIGPNR